MYYKHPKNEDHFQYYGRQHYLNKHQYGIHCNYQLHIYDCYFEVNYLCDLYHFNVSFQYHILLLPVYGYDHYHPQIIILIRCFYLQLHLHMLQPFACWEIFHDFSMLFADIFFLKVLTFSEISFRNTIRDSECRGQFEVQD